MDKKFAKVTLTCKTCGREFEVQTRKNSILETFRWAIWVEKNYTECDECKAKRSAVEAVTKPKA